MLSIIALTIAIIALICSLISLKKIKIRRSFLERKPSVSYRYEKRDLTESETRIQAETKDLSIDNQITITRGTNELKKINID